jgi:hypothetical protein
MVNFIFYSSFILSLICGILSIFGLFYYFFLDTSICAIHLGILAVWLSLTAQTTSLISLAHGKSKEKGNKK